MVREGAERYATASTSMSYLVRTPMSAYIGLQCPTILVRILLKEILVIVLVGNILILLIQIMKALSWINTGETPNQSMSRRCGYIAHAGNRPRMGNNSRSESGDTLMPQMGNS